jgi:purine-binding chemotaxis protein CheW
MMRDFLMFRVGRELFAAELRAIEEAVDLTTVSQVPGTSPAVSSVLTLRGALVPLFSAAAALGVALSGATTALIVRDERGRIAIAADDVEDVLSVADGEMRPVPTDVRDAGVLRAVVRRGRDLVAIVDLDALVAACRAGHQRGAA